MTRALLLIPVALLGLSFRGSVEKPALFGPAPASTQELHLDTGSKPATRQHVELLDDTFTLSANHPQEIELRFRVAPGLHINSHTPKDELLLPTTLKLTSTPSIQLLDTLYPAGRPFRLAIGAGETLDVYQDELRLRLRLAASPGTHTLDGSLRYQACDTASCFPPRTLPLRLTFNAR